MPAAKMKQVLQLTRLSGPGPPISYMNESQDRINAAVSWPISQRSYKLLWRRMRERHTGEADYAVFIDVPLLVAEELAARAGGGLQERVEGRRAAPLEVVAVFLH